MPTTTRTFRVFVSSTFEDLREERNVLQEKVFPKLEQFCLEKGARFQAIDLRWGVREEAGLDQKTMEICMAEIARCQKTGIKPNFIVLLGNRYGWRPLPARIQKDEFETVLAHIGKAGEREFLASWYDLDLNAVPPEYLLRPRKGIYADWDKWKPVERRIHDALREGARAADLNAQDLVKYDASATHQEILKGLGKTAEDRAHVFAFIRESARGEDPDLTKLKNYLKAVLPEGNIFPWSPGDHARLCDDVERSLRTVIAATADEFETLSEKASHDRFAEDRARHFKGRETVLDTIEQYLNGEDRRPLVVYGTSGAGKSAVLAVASEGKDAIRRFIGATPESSSGVTLLRSLCQELGERFAQIGDLPATFQELNAMFSERLKLATAEQPVILFIDALDQLSAQDPAVAIRWLPAELPPWCHVVVSTTEIPAAMRRAAMVPVESLPVADAGLALDAWFTEARRTLQPAQRAALLASFLRSGLPLYLRLAFEEARLWRSFDPLGECGLGDGLAGIIDRLFARLSEPANHGRTLVGHALGYLTGARYGLTEDEILAVLTKDDVVWKDVVGDGTRRRRAPPLRQLLVIVWSWLLAVLAKDDVVWNDVVGDGTRRRRGPPLRQLPVIVWSRLHLDLEPYLTERTVPGGTAVSFYHRLLAERVETTLIHHTALATHFAGQPYWLGTNVPNRRKLTELVRQQVGAGLPGDAATMLTDLDFVSAKCGAELVFDLEEDYRVAIAALPEAQEELREEERRQAELAGWTQTLIECAEEKRTPKPEEILKSVEPWNHAQIEAESKRIAERPTLLDRVKAFAGFVRQERHCLEKFGKHPGVVVQQALNSAPAGPVHSNAAMRVQKVDAPLLVRRWPANASYSPKSMLTRTLEGHLEPAHSVSLTPDGRCAVSGSDDATVRFWNLETGESTVLDGHTAAVSSVNLTPDGRHAVSGSDDTTVRFWNLETGESTVLDGHTGAISSVNLAPDGRRVVSGSSDGTVRAWNLETGESTVLDRHEGSVNSVSVTSDGTRVVSACNNGTLRIWNQAGEVTVLHGHMGPADCVSMTPDGRCAVSGSDDGTLRVWNLETRESSVLFAGDRIRKFGDPFTSKYPIEVVSVLSVSVTPDGRRAISASDDGRLRIWDLDARAKTLLQAPIRSILGVDMTADGRLAVSGNRDGTLSVWDLESYEGIMHQVHTFKVTAVSLTPDGRLAATGSLDGAIGVWNSETGEMLFQGSGRVEEKLWEENASAVKSVAVTPDGRRAVSANTTLRVWDLKTGKCSIRGWDQIRSLRVKPDGHRAVLWDDRAHELRVLNLETDEIEKEIQPYEKFVLSEAGIPIVLRASLTPDGQRVLLWHSSFPGLRLWNLETGEIEKTIWAFQSLGVTQDSRQAVSSTCGNAPQPGNPGTVDSRVFGDLVRDISWSLDGRLAVSLGHDDDMLRVWNLETCEAMAFRGHSGRDKTLGLTPDGRWAVTGSFDKSLRVLNLETGDSHAVTRLSAPCSAIAVDSSQRMAIGTDAGELLFFDIVNINSLGASEWAKQDLLVREESASAERHRQLRREQDEAATPLSKAIEAGRLAYIEQNRRVEEGPAQDEHDREGAEKSVDPIRERALEEFPGWPELSPEDQTLHLRAQRMARVRVAEMLIHCGDGIHKGYMEANLYGALRHEIDEARREFSRFVSQSSSMVDYLHREILRRLAHEDDRVLGVDYPGPMV